MSVRERTSPLSLTSGNYVISNFLKSYISSSRDRLLSCPSLTITLQIRPMCDASGCDDLRLIKVRNGSTTVDEPSFVYQWVIDDFNTKTKVCLSHECFSFLMRFLSSCATKTSVWRVRYSHSSIDSIVPTFI